KIGAVATPMLFVVTLTVRTPPVKVPVEPLPGATKVTTAPGTGLLDASRTVALSAMAKAVLTVADCPPPVVGVIEPGGPGLLVSEKDAGVPSGPVVRLAETVNPPAVVLAVKVVAVAMPLPFVVALTVVTLPVNL